MDSVLEGTRSSVDAQRGKWVDKHQANLDKITQGSDSAVLVMELGSGTQMSKLALEDRAALVRSPEFAQSLGRAMPAALALGLRDHLNYGKGNPTNMLFDQ